MPEKETSGYHTRQRAAVLSCFVKHPDTHFTAESLLDHLKQDGVIVGKTTVYRTLDKLVETGMIRKFTVGTGDSACYQYTGENHSACSSHFHLKCLICGTLFHVDCDHLAELGEHLLADHGFSVHYSQTILYGICSACRPKS
ncbi:MAG: transcriptional repressor [Clostridia bacterium]|nr:transcriptional repressor [Clostridia bacterium]